MKKVNRFISIFIAFLMCVSLYKSIPIVAITALKVFKYDNYSIEYSIINEWDNNQNVELTIKNTGNEPVYNWALGFDAGGEIAGIWNGTIYDNNGTNYIIKNAGYNYEILPDESVTFGCKLTDSAGL